MKTMKTNTPKYYLGIDAGGTRTRALLIASDGTVAGYGAAEAANPNNTSPAEAVNAIAKAAAAAWKKPLAALPRAAACFMGVAGIKAAAECAAFGKSVARTGIAPAAKCIAANDTEAALAGGLPGRPGIALIAGTGSFCLGRDATGRIARCGGWSWLIDDIGSGFYMGREALRATALSSEARAPRNKIATALLKHYKLRDPEMLLTPVFAGGFSPTAIAALAPLVVQAARDGDPRALEILNTGATGLAELVARVAASLAWKNAAPEVVLIGGLANSGAPYQPMLESAIARAVPGVRLAKAALPPAAGAALRALELDNVTITPDLLARLSAGLTAHKIK